MQILGSRVRLSVAAVICPQRSHSGNLINPRQLNSFFWQNGRMADRTTSLGILGIVVVFLCLSFFFFLFQGRRGPLGTAARRVLECETHMDGRRGTTRLFSFFFNFFFSRPPSPQSRPGLLTPPPRFVVSSHFASASASAFAFPSPSSSSRSPCLSSSLSTNRLRLNLRLSLYPRARPTKHLLVMF